MGTTAVAVLYYRDHEQSKYDIHVHWGGRKRRTKMHFFRVHDVGILFIGFVIDIRRNCKSSLSGIGIIICIYCVSKLIEITYLRAVVRLRRRLFKSIDGNRSCTPRTRIT